MHLRLGKKKIIHDHFIFSRHPERYPQQHNHRECGLFSLKAVIESYYPETCHDACHYTNGRFHKMIGATRPRTIAKVLQKYNIHAEEGHLKEKKMETQINFLKKHVEEGPVILVIAHSYNKENRFNILKTLLLQHYISIRGFDDEKEVFYCYDSHTDLRENDLPVGNIAINYYDLVSYRELAGR